MDLDIDEAVPREEWGREIRRFSQQEKDELQEQIRDNITEIVNQAAEEVSKHYPERDVEEVLDELERDLEQKIKIASSIKVNADVHEADQHDEDSDGGKESSDSVSPPPGDQLPATESRIPLAAGRTSTPIKVRTIKKHSKVNRELTSKPGTTIRPAVEDIEWDIASGPQGEPTNVISTSTTTKTSKSRIPKSKLKTDYDEDLSNVKIISTVNLENVVSAMSSDDDRYDRDDQEPENLIITGEVDDGDHAMMYGDDDDDIDEVILVQTPGSDFAPDTEELSTKGKRIETRTVKETITKDGATTEQITVITEEHYPNGEVVVRQQQQQQYKRAPSSGTMSSSGPSGQEDNSRDTITTTNNSLSINSESDSDSRGGSPYQMVRPSTGSGTNRSGAGKTTGSSSGSDVALHEAGAELSDDEPGTQ